MKLPRATRLYVRINGEMHYLWRAVDHEVEILESFVTRKRDKSVALAFMKQALKHHGRAEKIVTDGLKSYPAAMRELGDLERREMGQCSTIGPRIPICHSDEGSVQCCDLGR